jgi:hypothetical protein
VAGSVASTIGAPLTLMMGGGLCILGAVIFISSLPALRKLLRPIYVRMGILPEITAGIQSATRLTSLEDT